MNFQFFICSNEGAASYFKAYLNSKIFNILKLACVCIKSAESFFSPVTKTRQRGAQRASLFNDVKKNID
jgi:hypothetical protein